MLRIGDTVKIQFPTPNFKNRWYIKYNNIITYIIEEKTYSYLNHSEIYYKLDIPDNLYWRAEYLVKFNSHFICLK